MSYINCSICAENVTTDWSPANHYWLPQRSGDEYNVCNKCYNTDQYFDLIARINSDIIAKADELVKQSQELLRIRKYHLTFTTKDCTELQLRSYLRKFLQRKNIKKWVLCLEHISTNLHAHVYFEYDGYFNKRYLDSYKKFGFTKLQHIVHDNGVLAYVLKPQDDKKIIESIDSL